MDEIFSFLPLLKRMLVEILFRKNDKCVAAYTALK